MIDIVVEVEKGMVTDIYCDSEDIRFVVVDWDLMERPDCKGQAAMQYDHSKLKALPRKTRLQVREAIAD